MKEDDEHQGLVDDINFCAGDTQQFQQDQRFQHGVNGGVVPTVKLLWMTPDPLGAVAALASMYEGRVIRDMSDLTDDDRRKAWANTQKTHLQAPLEAVKLHFLIEGVDRAFTHQLVRQRTAVYAQESLRFAVVDDLLNTTTLPPSLAGTISQSEYEPVSHLPENDPVRWRSIWDEAILEVGEAYHALVRLGMPAEEARGLLPHCTATRIQYVTDLRNLVGHAGNRLCTQAQFHWRQVFTKIVDAIHSYGFDATPEHDMGVKPNRWQFEEIANSGLFKPICYQLGHCPFQASFDRECTIRERVQAFHGYGVPSDKWDHGLTGDVSSPIRPIQDDEWRMDPGAARA